MATKTTAKTQQQRPAPQPRQQHPAPRQDTSRQMPVKMDFGGVAPNAGMEGADRDSFALPFIVILQSLSPQLSKNKPEYIKGAEAGMFLNTANQETYSGGEGIIVLPVNFKRSFTAWGLREKGGGFKGEYQPSDPIIMTTTQDDRKRNILPGGAIQLVDTRMHAVILLNGEEAAPALTTFTSTQIKKSKRWMSEMQDRQKDELPTFAHCYKLTTVPESNDQGEWYGWKVEYVEMVTAQEHIDAAVAFYRALSAGTMKMNAAPAAGDPNEQQ